MSAPTFWGVCGVTAIGLSLLTGSVAQGGDEPPPDTLTRAAYVMTNGNEGTLDLRLAGKAAEVPGDERVVVSVGDSYISGEGGRWAGNSEDIAWSEYSDKLGPTAYADNAGREAVPWCHRSKGAEINMGAGVTSVNLACSGAETITDDSQKPFKPGIDFTSARVGGGAFALGQALLLQNLATSNPHRISMVVLSIGGNNFQFGHIVEECVTDYMDPRRLRRSCHDDEDLQALVSGKAAQKHRAEIAEAIHNVVTAMTQAGYTSDEWSLLVQTYPSPIADSRTIRYAQDYDRQLKGGCGFWNNDLDWANATVLPTVNRAVVDAVADEAQDHANIRLLELRNALKGHRLCETGTTVVGKLAWGPLWKWSPVRRYDQENAAAMSEWVAQIRAFQKSDPYSQQESLHPNYWGQKAYQSCLIAAYNGGQVRSGECVYAGLDPDGNPQMRLEEHLGWSDGLRLPTLNRSGTGAPKPVTSLTARGGHHRAVLAFQPNPAGAPVRAFLYRLRPKGRSWGPWVVTGTSTKVWAPLMGRGHYRAQVVAQNEKGASRLRAVGFRVR